MVREALMIADTADYLATRHGQKPDELMARALPLIDAALAADPRSAEAYHVRSVLFGALARAQADRRQDCENTVDQAVSALRHVIELDTQGSLGRAIAAFDASLAINPKDGDTLNNLGL